MASRNGYKGAVRQKLRAESKEVGEMLRAATALVRDVCGDSK